MNFIKTVTVFMQVTIITLALAIGLLMVFAPTSITFSWSLETLLVITNKIVGILILIGIYITIKILRK